MSVSSSFRRTLFAALAVSVSVGVSAQVPSTTQSASEEVITLTPFEVVSDGDVGYLAANSLAGSRLNTALKDTAASISVMTREFIDDLGATDLSDALVFATNLQLNLSDQASEGEAPSGNGDLEFNQRYRVRGLSAQVARNFFKWDNPTDVYNVERIDDSRGPNSILFGLGSAGGVVNVSTKQAQLNRNLHQVSVMFDTEGSRRTTLDFNQPVGKKAAIRVNALWNDSRTFLQHDYNESTRAHVAAKYRFTPKLQARVEYERGEVELNRGRTTGVFDSVTTWLSAGRPTFARSAATAAIAGVGAKLATNSFRYISNFDSTGGKLLNLTGQIVALGTGDRPILDQSIVDYSVNPGGPGQARSNPYESYAAYIEAQLTPKTFLELAYNHQEYDYESIDGVNVHKLYGDITTDLPGTLGTNPHADDLYLEGNWRIFNRAESADTLRATLATQVDAGKWGRYRIAGLGEFEQREFTNSSGFEVWDGAPFSANPRAAANRVTRRSYVTEHDWSTYYADFQGLLTNVTDPVSGRTLTSRWQGQASTDRPADQASGMLGLQGAWFDGKLNVGTGYRYDKVNIRQYGTTAAPNQDVLVDRNTWTDSETIGRTFTVGGVWHATKNISLLYNRSSNVEIPNSAITVLPDAGVASPPEGKGQDFGVAMELLDGRIYLRAVRFNSSVLGEVSFGQPYPASNNVILDGLYTNHLIPQAEYDARYLSFMPNGETRDKETEGYEFTLAGNPTRNWRLSANFSITDGTETNIIPEVVDWWTPLRTYYLGFPQNTPTGVGTDTIGTEIAEQDARIADRKSLEGDGIVGNRKYKANFMTRYTFTSGFLRGTVVGGGYRYNSKMVVGRMINGDGSESDRYSPCYGEANLLLGYNLRLKNKDRLNLQVNVQNLFDETDPIIVRYFPDTTAVRRITIRYPRSVRFSASYGF